MKLCWDYNLEKRGPFFICNLITILLFLFPLSNGFDVCGVSFNSALDDALPEEAIQLYTDACAILEEDGREQMAFDLYRAATTAYVKLEK